MKFFNNLLHSFVEDSLWYSVLINNQILSCGGYIHRRWRGGHGWICSWARCRHSSLSFQLELQRHPAKNAFLVVLRNAFTLSKLFVDKCAHFGFDVWFWLMIKAWRRATIICKTNFLQISALNKHTQRLSIFLSFQVITLCLQRLFIVYRVFKRNIFAAH